MVDSRGCCSGRKGHPVCAPRACLHVGWFWARDFLDISLQAGVSVHGKPYDAQDPATAADPAANDLLGDTVKPTPTSSPRFALACLASLYVFAAAFPAWAGVQSKEQAACIKNTNTGAAGVTKAVTKAVGKCYKNKVDAPSTSISDCLDTSAADSKGVADPTVTSPFQGLGVPANSLVRTPILPTIS